MRPFTFYTYQGSITNPPCTERIIMYLNADPILLSSTVISLFKEALKKPDMASDNQDFISSGDGDLDNNRELQQLNGRTVYIFDHVKFNCPDFKPAKRLVQPKGHYEKKKLLLVIMCMLIAKIQLVYLEL